MFVKFWQRFRISTKSWRFLKHPIIGLRSSTYRGRSWLFLFSRFRKEELVVPLSLSLSLSTSPSKCRFLSVRTWELLSPFSCFYPPCSLEKTHSSQQRKTCFFRNRILLVSTFPWWTFASRSTRSCSSARTTFAPLRLSCRKSRRVSRATTLDQHLTALVWGLWTRSTCRNWRSIRNRPFRTAPAIPSIVLEKPSPLVKFSSFSLHLPSFSTFTLISKVSLG